MNLCKSLCVLTFLFASTTSMNAQSAINTGWYGNAGGVPLPPTGTGGGTCGLPANTLSFDIQSNLTGVCHTDPAIIPIGVTLDLNHTYINDLIITLHHCGVSVVLSDGTHPTGWMDFAGSYTFRDDASTDFDAAPNDGTSITTGSYRPDNSLDPFRGLPAGGLWTLTICDRYVGDTGTFQSVSSFIPRDGVLVEDSGLGLAIPSSGSGGASGGCTNPANLTTHTATIVDPALVGEVGVSLNLTHTNAQDLLITIGHNGVTRTLFDGATQTTAGADFNGWYFFREQFAPINPSNVSGGTIGGVWYGAHQHLSAFRGLPMAGQWTLTVCDRSGSETGTLNTVALLVSRAALSIESSQPVSTGDLTVNVKNASRPGNTYFKPFTLTEGNYPYGWFYGIDIDVPSLITLIGFAPSFPTLWGTFDNCVEDPFTLIGPIPAGITFYSVAMEFDGGLLRQLSKPVIVTTQ